MHTSCAGGSGGHRQHPSLGAPVPHGLQNGSSSAHQRSTMGQAGTARTRWGWIQNCSSIAQIQFVLWPVSSSPPTWIDLSNNWLLFNNWMGLGILERTRIFSGIQFTTHFIQFFVVETKRFVGSAVNVILTRQTCSQRSSKAAESKRRAQGNYFSGRMCYMFLISKCRGDWDLGLCTTSGLAFGEPQRSGDFRKKNVFRRRKNRNLSLCCGSSNASPEVVHRPRFRSPLHFLIPGTYSKFARENNFRDCARGFNTCVHTRAQMSAIDVDKKDTIWALFLVPGMKRFWPWSTVPMHPQLRLFARQLFLDFAQIFPPMAPHLFGHHDSPSNLANFVTCVAVSRSPKLELFSSMVSASIADCVRAERGITMYQRERHPPAPSC